MLENNSKSTLVNDIVIYSSHFSLSLYDEVRYSVLTKTDYVLTVSLEYDSF